MSSFMFFPVVFFFVYTLETNHTHRMHTIALANSVTWSAADDLDALITVEVLFLPPDKDTGEQLQIANIQFNNLDIIGKICNFPYLKKKSINLNYLSQSRNNRRASWICTKSVSKAESQCVTKRR